LLQDATHQRAHLAHAGKAVIAVDGYAPVDQLAEALRRAFWKRDLEVLHVALDHAHEDAVLRQAREHVAPGVELVEHHAERIDVRTRIDVLAAADLLRRVVFHGADHLGERVAAILVGQYLGNAEVHDQDLQPAFAALVVDPYHDVAGLDVAVHHR